MEILHSEPCIPRLARDLIREYGIYPCAWPGSDSVQVLELDPSINNAVVSPEKGIGHDELYDDSGVLLFPKHFGLGKKRYRPPEQIQTHKKKHWYSPFFV